MVWRLDVRGPQIGKRREEAERKKWWSGRNRSTVEPAVVKRPATYGRDQGTPVTNFGRHFFEASLVRLVKKRQCTVVTGGNCCPVSRSYCYHAPLQFLESHHDGEKRHSANIGIARFQDHRRQGSLTMTNMWGMMSTGAASVLWGRFEASTGLCLKNRSADVETVRITT